jgi:hypothetical protein
VHDEGVGMPEAYLRERLGKPFESTKPAGMGIGVYESSQYLASVGGRLDIDSAPGRGTRVRVSLPLAEAGGRPQPEEMVPGEAAQPGAVPDSGSGLPDDRQEGASVAASVEIQR